jgi:rhamnose transport system ATP-binding protein
MVGREVTHTERPQDREPGVVRFSSRGLTAADGSCRDVSLEVRAGEVVGLYGLIGAGRSEWAQTVFGLRRLAAGELHVDGRPVLSRTPDCLMRAGVAYVPEDRLRQGLCRGLSVRANLVLAALRRLAPRLGLSTAREEAVSRPLVERLGIRLRSLEQPAGTLSGGNQQKVVLGRWLECDPRVLILDEPTRGVDVGAKVEIHALIQRLADEGRAVVLISSDLPEVVSQADRVGVFRAGRLIGFFDFRQATPEEIAAAALPEEKPVDGRKAAEKSASRLPAARRLPSVRELSLLVIVLAFLGLVHARTGDFLAPGNLRGLLTDTALLGFCALGAALVILVGALDISLGALMALSAGLAGRLWEQGQPWPVVALVAATLGAAGGTLNASLSLLGRVHPIVVTLGTLSVYRGLTLWWLGQDVQVAGSLRNRAFERIGGLPLVVWVGMGLAVLTWLFLTRTVLGRSFYALGSNPAAAHRAGIDRPRIWLCAFALQGVLAGLAGFLYLARSGNVQPTSFEDKTLEAIAAAVLGGVAITGGRGSVWGVLLGCLFLVSLAPAATQLHVSTSWQRTLVGGVLTVAVLLDTLWRRKSA